MRHQCPEFFLSKTWNPEISGNPINMEFPGSSDISDYAIYNSKDNKSLSNYWNIVHADMIKIEFSFSSFLALTFYSWNLTSKCNTWCRNMHYISFFLLYIKQIQKLFQVFPAYWNRYIELVSIATQKLIYWNIIHARKIF